MRKYLRLAALSLALCAAVPGTALAGWASDSTGWWYQYDDGNYAKAGIKEVEGKNYCFDSNGYMLTGWQYINWKWYYFDSSGPQIIGWVQLDGKWYYLDPNDGGSMYTYWLELPDSKNKSKTDLYYLDENGVMQTGMFVLSDDTTGSKYAYQADSNGVVICDKLETTGDEQMYHDADGIIYFRNAQTIKEAKKTGGSEWQLLDNPFQKNS